MAARGDTNKGLVGMAEDTLDRQLGDSTVSLKSGWVRTHASALPSRSRYDLTYAS